MGIPAVQRGNQDLFGNVLKAADQILPQTSPESLFLRKVQFATQSGFQATVRVATQGSANLDKIAKTVTAVKEFAKTFFFKGCAKLCFGNYDPTEKYAPFTVRINETKNRLERVMRDLEENHPDVAEKFTQRYHDATGTLQDLSDYRPERKNELRTAIQDVAQLISDVQGALLDEARLEIDSLRNGKVTDEEYLDLNGRYEQLQTDHDEALASLHEELDAVKKELAEEKKTSARLTVELQKKDRKVEALEKELEETRAKLLTMSNKNMELEIQNRLLTDKYRALLSQIDDLKKQNGAMDSVLKSEMAKTESLERKIIADKAEADQRHAQFEIWKKAIELRVNPQTTG